ncbi:hypothetical protein RRG08_022420 [Elysia crispata]|uniref:Uncharacterized protein n=1 Tax=Elysia crispata TaxID=231223 RepID=A0AAE0Z1C8_9GAST|nr:hypothetical protein RRG08_022420 [Elysia crispata]
MLMSRIVEKQEGTTGQERHRDDPSHPVCPTRLGNAINPKQNGQASHTSHASQGRKLLARSSSQPVSALTFIIFPKQEASPSLPISGPLAFLLLLSEAVERLVYTRQKYLMSTHHRQETMLTLHVSKDEIMSTLKGSRDETMLKLHVSRDVTMLPLQIRRDETMLTLHVSKEAMSTLMAAEMRLC